MAYWKETSCGNIPEHAFIGGSDVGGQPLYVAMAVHDGRYTPGKAGQHLNACCVPYAYEEHSYNHYKILIHPPAAKTKLEWVPGYSNGNVPNNAPMWEARNYFGRIHERGIQLGKVDKYIGKGFFYSFDGKEVSKPSGYEVLVETPSPVRYVLSNIEYDLSKAKFQLIKTKPFAIASKQSVNDSDYKVTSSVSLTYTKASRHDWFQSSVLELGLSVTVSAGIPFIYKASASMSSKISVTTEVGETHGTAETFTSSEMVELPPKSAVFVAVVAKETQVDIPYTAKLVTFYWNDATSQESYHGIYRGVSMTHFETKIDNEPIG